MKKSSTTKNEKEKLRIKGIYFLMYIWRWHHAIKTYYSGGSIEEEQYLWRFANESW